MSECDYCERAVHYGLLPAKMVHMSKWVYEEGYYATEGNKEWIPGKFVMVEEDKRLHPPIFAVQGFYGVECKNV